MVTRKEAEFERRSENANSPAFSPLPEQHQVALVRAAVFFESLVCSEKPHVLSPKRKLHPRLAGTQTEAEIPAE